MIIRATVFSDSDLEREIFIDGSLGLNKASLSEIIKILHETYSNSIGVEFLHIQNPDHKQWVQERIEEVRNKTQFTPEGKKFIYQRLLEAEMFENFLDKNFLEQKDSDLLAAKLQFQGLNKS